MAAIDKTRTVMVLFLATNNANLPWKFHPYRASIQVHPGENTRVAYYAKNQSNSVMTVQAIPNVAPGIAAKYLKKTECFCFTQQTLKSGESMDMPLLFHIDRDLPKNVNTVVLAYTLFDVSHKKPSPPPERFVIPSEAEGTPATGMEFPRRKLLGMTKGREGGRRLGREE